MHSASAGGYDFPADPAQPANLGSPFWRPDLMPAALQLRADPSTVDDPAAVPISLANLRDLDVRNDLDETWHAIWRVADATHQFWSASAPPSEAIRYFVMLPLDALVELRIEALLRLWRALTGRPVGKRSHDLPAQTRDRHILILRAMDGRSDGASHREIAEALLGFRGSKADWENDPRRNRTRRLINDGEYYRRGGYRDLLRYPLRVPAPKPDLKKAPSLQAPL